jgi:regulator of sigma E protease
VFSGGSLSWFYIIPILGILIFVHEVGHFVAARMCGVKVEEFGIGIPPRMFKFVRNGVIWSLNWIPFGGFVRVKGEDGENMDPDSMNAQPPHERAFFLTAGVIMNLLLAVLLMLVVVGIKGIPHNKTYITTVSGGSPAAAAGWQAGDRIVEVNGKEVETAQEIIKETRSRGGDRVNFVIERRGELYNSTLTPREHPPKGEGRVGVGLADPLVSDVYVEEVRPGSAAADAGLQSGDKLVRANNRDVSDNFVLQTELERFEQAELPITYESNGTTHDKTLVLSSGFEKLSEHPYFEDVSIGQIIPRGFEESYKKTVLMIDGILELFRNPEFLRQTAGPIGMAQLTSELVEESVLPVWYTLATLSILLSLNLAFLNLLPLPALDGGRLMFVILEVIRGRRIAPEKEGMVHLVGIVVLIGLMFVIAFNDIKRIVGGDSFLN